MKTTTPLITYDMNRFPRRYAVLIISVLASFAFLPTAHAVSPAPDGGYPGANTAEGQNALQNLTSGVWNTALGYQALFHDTTGNQNTATGYQALFSVTTGLQSVANGSQALHNNTTGSFNTATGFRAVFANTTGTANTGNGFEALGFNTTGAGNTADGFEALVNNTTGAENTAAGSQALYHNATGSGNTAVGSTALSRNTSGESNTATGEGALSSNGTGSGNTANGANALSGVNGNAFHVHNNNTAVGANALIGELFDLNNNTAVGAETLPLSFGEGQNNIAIGYRAGANLQDGGDNNIEIGNMGVDSDSNIIRIGTVGTQVATFIAGIDGVTVPSGVGVIIDSNGHLGTVVSSARFKKDIKPMEEASQSILALKPVSFQYKSDTTNTPQFGLVAEQVAAVNDALIVRDKNGKPFTVRYDAVNAMLLNEFLKEHRTVQEQKAIVAQLKLDFQSKLAEQQKRIEALTAGLQKVSAQLEANKPGPQTVNNNQ